MNSIKRSVVLAFPEGKRLPAFEANELRDYSGEGPVKVWIDEDGTAACCMFPHQTAADFTPGDVDAGAWVDVELDSPETIETVNELAARAWLTEFLVR